MGLFRTCRKSPENLNVRRNIARKYSFEFTPSLRELLDPVFRNNLVHKSLCRHGVRLFEYARQKFKLYKRFDRSACLLWEQNVFTILIRLIDSLAARPSKCLSIHNSLSLFYYSIQLFLFSFNASNLLPLLKLYKHSNRLSIVVIR